VNLAAVLVEDDERIAACISHLLQVNGYEVSVAHELATGLALVRTRSFDVAILDINLRDGTTSADIAAFLVAQQTPILFLTGMEEPELPCVSPSAVVGFLCKPVTRAALGTTLRILRNHARSHRELGKVRQLLDESQRTAETGSFQIDYLANEVTWTDETYRIFGVTRQTFTPTRESVLALVLPDDREPLQAVLMPTLNARDSRYLEATILQPEGEARTVRAVVRSPTPHLVIGTFQDVTERSRAEGEREAMERRMRIASEANRMKTEFLAQMSHELRTPLNAVLGLSEAMIERVFGELNPAQIETLETIHRSGRHLLDLINDLLDIARVEAGKLSIELEQATLRPLIDQATNLVANMLAARDQRLVIELAPAIPPVEIDRKRMQQVLTNLMSNASKFSPDGETITLRVTSDASRREVRIAIIDRGVGIAPENIERIFEPFVTIDRRRARHLEGVGLGLSLAKRLVELHHGQLLVESERGRGSTFTIVLAMSEAYVEPPLPRLAALHPGTILVVEDSEATVLAVRTYLESRGFRVRVASDGVTALVAAEEADVRLVLMDIQLPGLDGLEVMRRLRGSAMHKPIVALTAHAMPDDERRCLDAGASAYLSKPFRLRNLVDTIDRLLERA
jgi:signal transduction histidine kinase/DNA-binding NarL/FixJ family response regulator